MAKNTLFNFPNAVRGKICDYNDEALLIPAKILEMGLLPNTEFVILHRAPLGGPLYIEYGEEKTRVALREEEARFIIVEVLEYDKK